MNRGIKPREGRRGPGPLALAHPTARFADPADIWETCRMAFIPGAKNDVFVSYAHIDNEGGATGDRWVSDFVQRLDGALRQRLGCPVGVYFDTRSLEGHQNLSELLDNARNSAIFVAVLSPGYVNGKWTKDELEAYAAAGASDRIIFTIERLPLDGGPEAYPEALREHLIPLRQMAYPLPPPAPPAAAFLSGMRERTFEERGRPPLQRAGTAKGSFSLQSRRRISPPPARGEGATSPAPFT